MPAPTRPVLNGLRRSEEGTVAIIFALSVFVVVLITGLAIDVGRVMHANAKLTNAADAAALAAAKGLRDGRLSEDEVRELAENFFNANIAGSGGNYARISAFNVTIDRARNSVSIDLESHVPTVFAQIAGIDRIALPRASTAIFDSKDIELGLQLDVTGSMRGRKLADLKLAVGDLLDIMLPDGGSTNRVRVGLAPFAAAVNAGPYAAAVSNGRSRDGCVYERQNLSDQPTEAPATGPLAFKVASDLSGRIQACPPRANIVPLSDDKATLKRTVDNYDDAGSTAGHLGTAWAWYLVSPEWSGVWPGSAAPAAYGDGRTIKAVILMTDGIYNTIGGVNGGDRSATATQSGQIAVDTCLAMRGRGVRVYTVGFEAPASALATLRACASSASQHFDASNGDELRAAFRTIATELNNLRLSY